MKYIKMLLSISLAVIISILLIPAISKVKAEGTASVRYITYIDKQGWQENYVSNGKTAGTVGKALNLKALRIKVINDKDLGISYSSNIHNYGWQSNVSDNAISGSLKGSKYIETIKIELTGKNADKYDIYYRTYIKGFGWLGWAKNGQKAGTVGLKKGIQAISVKLQTKGSNAPGKVKGACRYGDAKVSYRTYNENSDWSNWTYSTDNQNIDEFYKIQGIQLNVSDEEHSGGISYKTLVKDKGWQEEAYNSNSSGVIDDNNIEAVQMKLTGEISRYYDVYYRVYVEKMGWLDWAKDGEPSGTSGYSCALKSMQIKLVKKGTEISLNTANHYKENLDKESDLMYLQWNSEKNELYIYRKALEENSWIRQVFSHRVCDSQRKANRINVAKNPLASCYDIWSMRGAYVCTRNEDGTFTDTYDYPIIHDDAEWEMAIREVINGTEASDFVGGVSHGNEVVNNITFKVDGVEFNSDNISKLNGISCKELEIKRYSDVYRDNTLEIKRNFNPEADKPSAGVKIATHYVDYVINHEDITLNQDLKWLVDTECNYSCMSMLGVKRVSGDGKVQITDSGVRKGDNTIYDCSKEGVDTGIYRSMPNCKNAYLWNSGKYGGLNCHFTEDILSETDLKGKYLKVSNHKLYNKFYFAYCENGQKVNSGDDWNSSARYTMDYCGKY